MAKRRYAKKLIFYKISVSKYKFSKIIIAIFNVLCLLFHHSKRQNNKSSLKYDDNGSKPSFYKNYSDKKQCISRSRLLFSVICEHIILICIYPVT